MQQLRQQSGAIPAGRLDALDDAVHRMEFDRARELCAELAEECATWSER